MSEIDREELDKYLRNANIYLRRGDLSLAEEQVRAALAITPDDSGVQEILGDILLSKGERAKAAEAFKLAVELNPKSATAETKYARIVLGLSEESLAEKSRMDLFDSQSEGMKSKNMGLAMIGNILWPGLGHWMIGESQKATILASLAGVITVLLLVTGQLSALFSIVFTVMVPQRQRAASEGQPGFISVLLWSASIAVYVYSLVDVPISLGKRRKGQDDYTEPSL